MSNEQPHTENHETDASPQHEMGLMLQRRALYRQKRASEKHYRSPKQIVLISLAVAITMSLFLLMIDKGVKVAHHIINIWSPVIFDTKKTSSNEQPKPTTTDPAAPYMIKIEPSSSQSGQSSSASSH